MKKRFFGRKKNWMNKKCSKWNGKDMLKATTALTVVCSAIAGAPIIGLVIKEKIDG